MKIIATNEKIISLENVCSVTRHIREEVHTCKGVKCTDYITTFHFDYSSGQNSSINIVEKNINTPKANEFWEEIQRRLSAD